MFPEAEIKGSREEYVRHRPTNSSAAKLSRASARNDSKGSKHRGDVLVVVVKELRRVVNEECRSRNDRRRVAPESLRLGRKDDPHVLVRRFALDASAKAHSEDMNATRTGLEPDSPALDRILVVPNLLARAGHEPEERDGGWVVDDDVPRPVEEVDRVEHGPS